MATRLTAQRTVQAGKNLKGSNLTNASLFQADATDADFRAVNLGKACLTNSDLSGARINASTNFSTAIFCGTLMPDGSINDRDCGQPTRCCEVCTPLEDECNDDTAPCCDGGVCQEGSCVRPALPEGQRLRAGIGLPRRHVPGWGVLCLRLGVP